MFLNAKIKNILNLRANIYYNNITSCDRPKKYYSQIIKADWENYKRFEENMYIGINIQQHRLKNQNYVWLCTHFSSSFVTSAFKTMSFNKFASKFFYPMLNSSNSFLVSLSLCFHWLYLPSVISAFRSGRFPCVHTIIH
jgi:hypothetical protein